MVGRLLIFLDKRLKKKNSPLHPTYQIHQDVLKTRNENNGKYSEIDRLTKGMSGNGMRQISKSSRCDGINGAGSSYNVRSWY